MPTLVRNLVAVFDAAGRSIALTKWAIKREVVCVSTPPLLHLY
jgi:hypothetical protein